MAILLVHIIPALDPGLKDLLQAIAWLAAAAVFVLTVVKFRSDLRETQTQRGLEYRWRQSEVGKRLNDEMQEDKLAWAAMQMLDLCTESRAFQMPSGKDVIISRSVIGTALGSKIPAGDETSIYIRDCFDSLFYYMAMLEHYISINLIRQEDVAYPIEYFVPLMTQFRTEIDGYLTRYKLWRTRKFLERYDAWNEAGGD